MAQLDVQPKKSNPWWFWLILVIIVIIILFLLLKGSNKKPMQAATTDSTRTSTDTSGKQAVAITQPDWNSVDFNSPKSSDGDITDKDVSVSGNGKYAI